MNKKSAKTQKPLDSILVKPAGPDCNMSCSYCFYTGKASLFPESKTHRMSLPLLETMIKQAMAQSGPQISFGWQGGEPTLMGREFFETAVEMQGRFHSGQAVGNAIQTNGLLLDRAWAAFLARNDFLVGISIDGAKEVHDRRRRDKGGKGTWARVRDRAAMLLDHGVEVNALAVVTDLSADLAVETYGVLKDMGLVNMQFIPCVERDLENPGRPAPFSVRPAQYGKFLCELYDLWRADFKDGKATTTVRFFDAVFYSYVGLAPPDCSLLPECGNYVVVEHNGDVFPCDFFVEPQWRLGNIEDGLMIEMLNSERQTEFGAMKSRLPPACRDCKWKRRCRGGCPKERGLVGKNNYLSPAFKAFFKHADQDLERLARDWKKARPQ